METSGILAVSHLDQPTFEVRDAAQQLGYSHLVVMDDGEPRSVVAVESVEPTGVIAVTIELGDQLQPAPDDIEVEPELRAGRLYVGKRFAVAMRGAEPLVLFAEGAADLRAALRSRTYALVMTDPFLPGPSQPVPKDRRWRRCPVGPHRVKVDAGVTLCPQHQQPLAL
jgi:hypothetical protein